MSLIGWIILGFLCGTMALAVSVIAVDEKTYVKRLGREKKGRRDADA